MFQPNRPQWVTIVVTFVFASLAASDSSQAAVFFVITGALIVWWLEGRRQKRNKLQKRNELEQWTRRQAEGGAKAEDGDLSRLLATYDIETHVPKADINSLRNAAEQGDAEAQFDLGVAYTRGQGVPQDYLEAHKWANLAAARAHSNVQQQYAENRDALTKRMTPAQIAEAQKLAREWQAAFDARQE
jgi:TPR repeat protein